jgi:hypothetical protein
LTATNRPAPAQRATDAADDAAYAAGWNGGTDGGLGFDPWSQERVGADCGFFIGPSAIGGAAWGLWANSGASGTNPATAAAVRLLENALVPSNTFRVDFQNQWIENGRSVGFGLLNGQGEYLFEFMFIGGRGTYSVNDRLLGRDTGVAYTDGGLSLAFDLTGPETYRLRVGGQTLEGELAQRDEMRIRQFRAWNYASGAGSNYDFFINSLAVTNAPLQTQTATAETWVVREAAPVVGTPLEGRYDAAQGMALSWGAMEGRAYDVYRSTNLLLPGGGFVPVATGLPTAQTAYTAEVRSAERLGIYQVRFVDP